MGTEPIMHNESVVLPCPEYVCGYEVSRQAVPTPPAPRASTLCNSTSPMTLTMPRSPPSALTEPRALAGTEPVLHIESMVLPCPEDVRGYEVSRQGIPAPP